MTIAHFFARFAETVSHAAGRPITSVLSVAIILAWAVSGPFFGFSDTWQLIINTFTTLVTFLMVFLIQNTQNRDATAVHAKLDELVRVGEARNTLIGVEHLDDKEVEQVREEIERLRSRPNPRRRTHRVRLKRRNRARARSERNQSAGA